MGADGITGVSMEVGRDQRHPGAAMEEAGRKMTRSCWEGNQESGRSQVKKAGRGG